MGKKQKNCLGRSLIKASNSTKLNKSKTSLLHTAELQDGTNFNRIDFKSITEETDFESFLATAELADSDFKAEKLNIKLVQPCKSAGVLTTAQHQKIQSIQEDNRNFLRIPRRPVWDRSMNAEELAAAERKAFSEWRQSLALLQDKEGIILTPFEKNLEFWRQLWRVIERSDVVVQIVDARNPLLFRCEDLAHYVKEVSPHKENLLLVNKADFLTKEQRKTWAQYFKEANIKAVFYSAMQEIGVKDPENEGNDPNKSSDNKEAEEALQQLNIQDEDSNPLSSESLEQSVQECQSDLNHLSQLSKSHLIGSGTGSEKALPSEAKNPADFNLENSSKVINRMELIEMFECFNTGPKLYSSHITVGLVGYPNVGKSSCINSLLQEKKTGVSATPGKTKHFQTLFLSKDLLLCDCPGLVFPAFVTTKEEMILSGILPIDQMKDHVPAINLLLSRIPTRFLEAKYGISLPQANDEDSKRRLTSEEFLGVYGFMRGIMSARGTADHPRSSRPILKDYVKGRILYCHGPPGTNQEEFHPFFVEKVREVPLQPMPLRHTAKLPMSKVVAVDEAFFAPPPSGFHYKGKTFSRPGMAMAGKGPATSDLKPGRLNQLARRNRRQKGRIKYAHLDA